MMSLQRSTTSPGVPLHVLLIEDDLGDARRFEEQLQESGCEASVRWEQCFASGLQVLNDWQPDVLVVSSSLSDGTDASTVEQCLEATSGGPVVVLSGGETTESAQTLLEAKAIKHLFKDDLTPQLLSRTLQWAVERARLEAKIRQQDQQIRSLSETTSSRTVSQEGAADGQSRGEALRRSKERYKALFEDSIDAILVHDLEGRITEANPRAEKLFGYDADELARRTVFDLHPPEDQDVAEAKIGALQAGKSFRTVTRYVRKNGSTFWGEISANVADLGDATEVRTMIRDVSERIEAERQLRLQASALEASATAIAITDREGRMIWVNPAFAELTGYTEAEVMGHTMELLNSGEQNPSFYEDLWDTIRSGEVWQGELVNQRKDGSLYVEEQTITPVADREGRIQNFIAVKQDVTDRKAAERTRARLAAIVESSQSAIVSLSLDGKIQTWNGAAKTVFGFSREEAHGEHISLIVPSHREQSAKDLMDRIRRGESVTRAETVRERKDGAEIDVRLSASPILEEGEVVGISFICDDITERKQLESQLRHAQKMETVGTLAGGIAHDFNNILHSAMAYLQLSREDLPDDHVVDTYLVEIEDGLKQAEELVRKLLAFSRSETTTTPTPVEVAPLVRETLELAEPSLPKRVKVRTELSDACTVMGDAVQLRQVVMNLVTNAGQAMAGAPSESGDVLDIRVQRVDVDADLASRYVNLDTGQYVQVAVSDTGPGMDEETRSRVFDPFFTTKEARGQRGTGLGLSVVHSIVQNLNGEITVYSQLGEGTTFNVYLPVFDGKEAAGTPRDSGEWPTSAKGPEEGRVHVLVVDDDESVIELESIRLPHLGYAVTTCSSAREALGILSADPDAVDLVLTDYNMPGMSGLDLTGALREQGIDVPIVLMSGFQAQISEVEALQAGAGAVLQKPVGREKLNRILVELSRQAGGEAE